MGEVADMMLDGTLCQVCGEFLNDDPPGYPCTCYGCRARPSTPPTPKVKCPICFKTVKAAGLADHTRVVHPASASTERRPK